MKTQGVGSNAFILNRKNQILLVKRALDDTDYPGHWELPGGKIDYGETAQESLQREVKEECGLDVNVLIPLASNFFYIGETQIFETTFLCEISDGKSNVKLSHEHSEYKWVNPDDIDSLKLPKYMDKVVKSSKKALKFRKE